LPALDLTVNVTLPATTAFAGKYELRIGECTGRDDLDVRRETGYSLIGLLQEVQKDPGLALTFVCVVAWLVRRKQYPEMLFERVLESVPWGSDFELDLPDEPVEDDLEGKVASGQGTPESSPPSLTPTASGPGKSTT
jgi:hypothetical protein